MAIESRGDLASRHGSIGRIAVAHSWSYRSDNLICTRTPIDWGTGKQLDANTIRNLENTSKLDRHHVFPREFLKGHSTREKISHGLNGVLLTKASNLAFSKKDPALYLKRILKDSQSLSENELRNRVESHLVPYDALKSDGTPKSRYKNFVKQRARLVAAEIANLVKQ